MIVFFKLLLAHLLGDFIFQTDKTVKNKEKKKIRSVALYVHVLLHGLLSMLFIWDIRFWGYALLIVISHFLIDLGKIYLQKVKLQRLLFFVDQGLHIAILICISYWYQKYKIDLHWLWTDKNIIVFTTCIFLTKPSSVIIKIFISKWTPVNKKNDSLQNAGNWIGILERLLIFGFIMLGKWEAIGFLIAAKSVFRFNDLKDNKDRILTEYILIGTLLSFAMAITAGLICLKFLNIV